MHFTHLPFKSDAGSAGTCRIAGGDTLTSFLAITEMLAAEYDTNV